MTKTLTIITMTVLLVGVVAPGLSNSSVFAASNLVTNGSFESSCTGGFETLVAGSTAITGWTVTSGTVDWMCTLWESQDGDRDLDMTGYSDGTVTQDIVTESGKVYTMTFWMAGNPAGGNPIKSMTVSADSTSETFTFDTTDKTFTDMGWVQNTLIFIADDANTTLTFTSNGDTFYGPTLDNVSVEEYSDKKIDVCHKDKKTINISVNAVPAHIAHGDTLGPCE